MRKLKSGDFHESRLSTYDIFDIIYYLATDFIKNKLKDSTERVIQRKSSLYDSCKDTFLPLRRSEIILYDLGRKCVKLAPFSWPTYSISEYLYYFNLY